MHTIRKALLLLCNLESTGSYLINRHMKHKISPILYIAGIFLLFATCTRHPHASALLQQTDSLLHHNQPDSVLQLLFALKDETSLSETERMKLVWNKAMAHYQLEMSLLEDSLLCQAVINRLSFNASYKWLYFNTRYIHGRDAILQLSQAYSEDDPTVSLFSFYNRYCSDKLYSSLTIAPTIGIWSPQLTLMLLQQWYKVDVPGGLANFNNPMESFSLRNHFSLSSGFGLDIDFGADTQGDNENTYVAEGCWYANVGLYKSFFNERLSIRLQADDLFNSSAAKAVLYSGNRVMAVKQEVRRSIALTLRYKFNATKSKYKGTGAGNSQKSRM